MNTKEIQLVALLKTMQKKHGVLGVKAEFEAEGTRRYELSRLKHVASEAGLNIALKIGGPEDVWGILQAREVGVAEIVAPMVESNYALLKFLEAFQKHIPVDEREHVISAINVETFQTYLDIDKILDVGTAKGLHGITIGRVDLVGSMGLGRDNINSKTVFDITRIVFKKTKAAGMRTVMGGGIEDISREFIAKLVSENLLDRFETRKIIFDAKKALPVYEDAVLNAHRFEHIWLGNKTDYYDRIAKEDLKRIEMLEKRLSGVTKEKKTKS